MVTSIVTVAMPVARNDADDTDEDDEEWCDNNGDARWPMTTMSLMMICEWWITKNDGNSCSQQCGSWKLQVAPVMRMMLRLKTHANDDDAVDDDNGVTENTMPTSLQSVIHARCQYHLTVTVTVVSSSSPSHAQFFFRTTYRPHNLPNRNSEMIRIQTEMSKLLELPQIWERAWNRKIWRMPEFWPM